MFSKRRTDASSSKAAQKKGQQAQQPGSSGVGSSFGQVGADAQRSVLAATTTAGAGKGSAKASKAAKAAKAAERDRAKKLARATKHAQKNAQKKNGQKPTQESAPEGRRLGLLRRGKGGTDEVSMGPATPSTPSRASLKGEKHVWAPGEKPSVLDLSEWSLRRKVALVLAVPVMLAAVFGGLRVRTEMAQADNYAATASQVKVLRPAVDYLAAAEEAAVVARANGINNPKLDAAQQAVVAAGTKLIEARDAAALTPTQLRLVNDVISLSEQMRNGMAYVSLTSMTSQVRQLERGVTQVISSIVDEQMEQEPALLVLAQALDGRLSLSLQAVQVANAKTIPPNPVELYSEFGVELASIDRLAIALGQTDSRVLAIRQANAQRLVNARGGNMKVSDAGYAAYDTLIEDLLNQIDKNLATETRNAKVLTWVDSIIIGLALLAAIILALLVSRLLLNPIRRVRAGALEVAHERLPEAVRRIRSGEDPGEIVPIGVTTHEETGQLARAVDDLHRQAVRLASGEAALRTQVGDMFVTLSRRNTSLINQQLGLIETLESDEEDPQRLESLFRLDHLAARMRRNAESLVILSGAPTRATEQEDLSLTDVLQAAIAGVQDYRRVQLDAAPAQRVTGEAASDVVHLLAELVDNALSYSPPSSTVLVTSSFTRGGVVVQVTDAGLGIADDALGELNDKLRSGGEVNADTARRMGLFVVSRLAQRHGLQVSLDQNDRMGITATVFLPTTVLSDTARLEAGSGSTSGSAFGSTGPADDGYGSFGGAQVIELGASTAPTDVEEREPAEVYSFGQPATEVAPQSESRSELQSEPQPEPEPEPYDPITAAINAYGLPQRRPGASGAGRAGTPQSMGGGFFERVEPEATTETPAIQAPVSETSLFETPAIEAPVVEEPVVDELVVEEPAMRSDTEDVEDEDVVDAVLAEDEESHQADGSEGTTFTVVSDDAPQEEVGAPIALGPSNQADEADETDVADEAVDLEPVAEMPEIDEPETHEPETHEPETHEPEAEDELAPVLATLPLAATVPFESSEVAAHANGIGHDDHLPTAGANGNGNGFGHGHGDGQGNALAGLLAKGLGNGTGAGLADGLADGLGSGPANGSGFDHGVPTPVPQPVAEEDSPIFRSLRSNWLSADTGERPWADSEVDAGWDAADRVEATPPTRRTETGLPMRRPGNRLIPGGLTTQAAPTVRDPEAIRARLAAHAAGVSRGRRTAATSEALPTPTTQEVDPA